MQFMKSAKFVKIKNVWSVKVPLPNALVAAVIEMSDDYLVNINHPLTKQRRFETLEDVDKYLIAMSKLGGVDD